MWYFIGLQYITLVARETIHYDGQPVSPEKYPIHAASRKGYSDSHS